MFGIFININFLFQIYKKTSSQAIEPTTIY